MSVINVTVTSAGAANVSVSNGSTVNATVGNGGAVNVSTGTISPGNATVVSGTLAINSTTTLAAGAQAYVVNNGTAYAAKLDIGIPAGPATSVTVGNTTTLDGGNASVTGTTNGSTLTLAFAIPRGANGTNGTNGTNGVTPSFAIGNTSTLSSGSSATVTATPSNGGANITLDFGIPRGADGTSGSSSWSSLTGVPSNFPTNTTLVSGLSAGYSAANHAHNYVTSLNNLTGALTLAAGGNVTLTANGSTLTIAASGGGLGENDAVDGGNYVGEILYGITFQTQPQSQTVSTGAFTVSNVTMPTGTYATVSFANGTYFATPSNEDTSGDYLAKSTNGISWTRQNGAFATAADYRAVQFGGGLYLTLQNTTGSGQKYATSADGVTWTERTPPFVFRDVKHIAGLGWVGHYVASGYSRFQVSTDGVTWANLYNGNAFQTEAVSFALIAGKFVVNGSAATISGGSIGSFGASPSGLSGSLVAASSTAAVYAGGGQLHVVDWAAESVTLTATFAEPYSAAFHSPSGRWLIVNESGVFTTSGTSTPALRLSFTGGIPQNQSRVYVSSGGRATVLRATGGSASYELFSSDDGGLTWTSRQTSTLPGGTPLGAAAGDLVVLLPPFLGVGSSQIRVVTPGGTTATASFTVAATATSGNPISYQWQNSVDAGTSWANVANATSNTLALAGLTTSDNGTRFRAVASATGATPTPSQSATLTVS